MLSLYFLFYEPVVLFEEFVVFFFPVIPLFESVFEGGLFAVFFGGFFDKVFGHVGDVFGEVVPEGFAIGGEDMEVEVFRFFVFVVCGPTVSCFFGNKFYIEPGGFHYRLEQLPPVDMFFAGAHRVKGININV